MPFTPDAPASPGFKPSGGGFTPDAPDETSSNPTPAAIPKPVPASTPTPRGVLSHDQLSQLWVKHGGDPAKADLMAWVFMNESGGDPGIVNKDSGAAGLSQVLPSAHPEYKSLNLKDPDQNMMAAVELYNNRVKRGQTGLEDWEDSKDKGAYGGWGKHLPVDFNAANQEHDLKTKRQYNALETFFNTLDAPFYFMDALVRNGQPYTNFPQAGYVWDQLKKGKVNEVSEHYNLMSPDQLKDEAAHGDHIAEYFLKNPVPAGIAAGVAEFANPVQNIVGGVASKAFKVAFDAASQSVVGRMALNMFSPFMHIAMAGGERAKQVAVALAQRIASAPAEGAAIATEVFRGFSKLEQEAIVHLYHSNAPLQFVKPGWKIFQNIDPGRIGAIHQQSVLLRVHMKDMMARKMAAGVSDKGDTPGMFPYKGAEEQPFQNVKGAGVGHGLGTWGDEPIQDLKDVQAREKLDPKWSPAQQMAEWWASSQRRLDLEDSLKRFPKDVLLPRPKDLNLAQLPRDKAGLEMLPWEAMIKKFPELAHVQSPTLRDSLISPALAKYAADKSTQLFDDGHLYLAETSLRNKMINQMLKGWDSLTDWNRRAIIANPVIHPAFNLANNAHAAGVPAWEIATLVTKSIVSSFGGKALVEKFAPHSVEFSKWMYEAIAAGAVAQLKEGDVRLLTSQWKDLDTGDKVKKIFAEAGAWNARGTFGKHGEEAFATALFRQLVRSGRFHKEEAAQMVREALGNYQNVGKGEKTGIDRLIFFYPWLKGNMPYWVRKLATSPQYLAAPEQAARANNLLVDDPAEYDYKHPAPAKDFQWITGDKESGFLRHTPILPQRMAADFTDMLAGDPAKLFNKLYQVLESRAQPGPQLIARSLKTAISGPSSPLDPQDFDTMWSKNAPRGVQWDEFAENVIGELAPVPLFKYVAQQALVRGVSAGEIQRKLVGAAAGDFVYSELDKGQQIKLHQAMTYWTKQVREMAKNIPFDEKQRRLMKFYDIYDKKVRKIVYKVGATK